VRLTPAGLVGDARGEVELIGGVLVIRRIHVTYRLATPAEDREKVRRAYAIHAENCPVYRSISAAIAITTQLDWHDEQP
jgi:uncharacterized OsmC-like protein